MISSSLSNLTYFRGRVALYAILKALGISKGDEVATQAFTCVAVAEGIMATGARPLYIDIESMGFNMDVDDLLNKVTPETCAIILQHTFGIPGDVNQIKEAAKQKGILIIEDCCHTLASIYRGKRVGAFGVGSFYSFEWGKPVVVGIGGSAVANHAELQKKMEVQYEDFRFPSSASQYKLMIQYLVHRLLYRPSLYWPIRNIYRTLASFGLAKGNYNPINEEAASEDFSLRMSNYQKKMLVNKLHNLNKQTIHSIWVASEYRSRIRSRVVLHPNIDDDCEVIFARYPLVAQNKQNLLVEAKKAHVELADWYFSPIHPLAENQLNSVYYEANSCPNAEKMCKKIVTLPTNMRVKKRDIDKTVHFLNTISI